MLIQDLIALEAFVKFTTIPLCIPSEEVMEVDEMHANDIDNEIGTIINNNNNGK